MVIKSLSEVAFIDISGVDKKFNENETEVKLCNFTDVYYNWAISKDNVNNFMIASANKEEIRRFLLKKGSVAITKDSETRDDIGIACYIADDLDNTLLGYHCALIVPKTGILYGKYLNAYLHTKMARTYFSNQASGSGQRYTLTIGAIGDVKIPMIPYEEQVKIGNIFSLIDRKIVNNNKINFELESMAKTLYNYWFLQFDFPNENGKPYKSSGGKMVWNEELKREIPEGWEAIKLKNIVKKTNRVYDYNKESKTYDLSIMPSNSISINDTSSSKDFETNLFAVKEGDILFGSIRPYLRKAGIASYDGAVAGTIHCYEVIKESNYNLALFTLTSENMFKYAINNSKGTKMPVITSDDLLEFMLPYNEEIAKKFNNIKIREIIIANIKQSNELASLRDFLLPLLMNGQVKFKDN